VESEQFFKLLSGQRVSHAWLSHSALYLELGRLSPGRKLKSGGMGNSRGQLSIFAGYEWRVERPLSIIGGSGSKPRRRSTVVSKLVGQTIESVGTSGRIPELRIEFSAGLSLVTFSNDCAQPDWAVHVNEGNCGYFEVRRGKLRFSLL
jgi:hypothetical protein